MKYYQNISMNLYPTTMGAYFLLMSLAFFAKLPNGSSQQLISSAEDRKTAYMHLQDLKKGVLLVVLQSDAKTESALQEVLDSDKSSTKQKKKAAKRIKKSKNEREEFHRSLVDAFHNLYSFSAFRLIYDKDLKNFMSGTKGLLLNTKLDQDKSIDMPTAPIYIAKEGYTSSTDGVRVLSYIVYDAENNRLKHPFPSVKISDIGPAVLLRSLMKESTYRSGSQIVERFDYLLKHRMASLRDKIKSDEDE